MASISNTNSPQELFADLIEPDITSRCRSSWAGHEGIGSDRPHLGSPVLVWEACAMFVAIRARLAELVAERLVTSLAIPSNLRHAAGGDLDNIGNATALGAALLAIHGAQPIWASGTIGTSAWPRERGSLLPGFWRLLKDGFASSRTSEISSSAMPVKALPDFLILADQDDPVLQPGWPAASHRSHPDCSG